MRAYYSTAGANAERAEGAARVEDQEGTVRGRKVV
jgi:hypothetical protein